MTFQRVQHFGRGITAVNRDDFPSRFGTGREDVVENHFLVLEMRREVPASVETDLSDISGLDHESVEEGELGLSEMCDFRVKTKGRLNALLALGQERGLHEGFWCGRDRQDVQPCLVCRLGCGLRFGEQIEVTMKIDQVITPWVRR